MKTVSNDYIAEEEAVEREPTELYHIWDQWNNYYLTDGDTSVTISGIVYGPSTITRGDITFNSELEVSELDITGVYLEDPIVEYITMNPLEILWVSVMKLHRDQDPLETSVIFLGQIKSVEFKGNEARVTVVGFEHYLKQAIPKYRYQPICNNFVYDTFCSLDKDTYKDSGTVTAVSTDGLSLTVAGISTTDGYFKHGYIEDSDHNKRMITSHTTVSGVSTTLGLRYKIHTVASGIAIDVYPGCDLNIETCRDKFNNVVNFFGHPYIPLNNPALRI